MSTKQFIVIGMGRFGSSVAKGLFEMGNDVLAVDKEEDKVQDISSYVTHAVQADCTDLKSLKSLGISNFDTAVVAVGSDMQSSIMITLLLKEIGIKYIIAKADNDIHAKLLFINGADRVIRPEKDMGIRVARNLAAANLLDYMELSKDCNIAEILVKPQWEGKSLEELNISARYGINVVAIKRGNNINISLTRKDTLEKGDILVTVGSTDGLDRLQSQM